MPILTFNTQSFTEVNILSAGRKASPHTAVLECQRSQLETPNPRRPI
jgi:hypothetical protein